MSSELNQMSAVQVAPSGERSQGRGRYGVVCRGNPVWSIPERLELKYLTYQYLPNGKGHSRKVTWCVWQVVADKSITKRPRNIKIGGKVVHRTGNNEHQFQGQRSRSPGRQNVETGSPSYLPNGKAHVLQTWCTDGGRRPVSPWWTITSKVKC